MRKKSTTTMRHGVHAGLGALAALAIAASGAAMGGIQAAHAAEDLFTVTLNVESPVRGDYDFDLVELGPSSVTVPAGSAGAQLEMLGHSTNALVTLVGAPATAVPFGSRVTYGKTIAKRPSRVTKISVPSQIDSTITVFYREESPDRSNAPLTVSQPSAIADGADPIEVTLRLQGEQTGLPVSSHEVQFSTVGEIAGVGFGDVVAHGDGTYSAPIRSTVVGAFEVQATVRENLAEDFYDPVNWQTYRVGVPAQVEFVQPPGNAARSEWSVQPDTTQTVGESLYATAVIRDAQGIPVGEGHAVQFDLPAGINEHGHPTEETVLTDATGTATLALSAQAVGEYSVAARTAGEQIGEVQTLHFTAAAASPVTSTIAVSGTQLNVAEASSDTVTVTVRLRDAYGNEVVEDAAEVLIRSSAGSITATQPAGDAPGTYVARLSGAPEEAGTHAELTYTLNAQLGEQIALVQFTGVAPPAAEDKQAKHPTQGTGQQDRSHLPLAQTGSGEQPGWFVAGAMLLVIGAGVLLISERRKRTHRHTP